MLLIATRGDHQESIMTGYWHPAGHDLAHDILLLQGTDFEDPGDVLVDTDCAHTQNVRNLFTASGKGNVRLHSGFFRAWQAMEREVTAAISKQLQQVRLHLVCGSRYCFQCSAVRNTPATKASAGVIRSL
jgi:hypothetical protein